MLENFFFPPQTSVTFHKQLIEWKSFIHLVLVCFISLLKYSV